jgi:hypothetical protein
MKSKISILLAALALIASTLACATGELSLDNPRLSKDDKGDQTVTAFAPDDTFYVVADLNNATKGTKVTAKWYAVNVEGYESGQIGDEKDGTLNITEDYFTGSVNFSLTKTVESWPTGEYKVELYLNDQLKHTLNFTVQ